MPEKCRVPGCQKLGAYHVFLYDVYTLADHVFCERDFTCPYLCSEHMAENETRAEGTGAPRGRVRYP